MRKWNLGTVQDIAAFVTEYTYDVGETALSRCIDGRYKENAPDSVAVPGADIGELFAVCALEQKFACAVSVDQAFQALVELVGGNNNLRMHTDDHSNEKGEFGGCGHVQLVVKSPEKYMIEPSQVQEVLKLFHKAHDAGAQDEVLAGAHAEDAVLIIDGEWGVAPHGKAFIYHHTFANRRRHKFVRLLLKHSAVAIPSGCDEHYLYQILSEAAEDHLNETILRLAREKPMYLVKLLGADTADVEPLGIVGQA